MRVFVLGTGRCGTSTFYHAVKHAANKTVGHESVYWQRTEGHDYPEDHVEIGHPLVWVVDWLVDCFPDARFVHLVRDKEACVDSLYGAGLGGLRLFYRLAFGGCTTEPITREVAGIYYDVMNNRIRRVVPTERIVTVRLEEAGDPSVWRLCWDWMECQGGFDASLSEWGRRYNHRTTGSRTTGWQGY